MTKPARFTQPDWYLALIPLSSGFAGSSRVLRLAASRFNRGEGVPQ